MSSSVLCPTPSVEDRIELETKERLECSVVLVHASVLQVLGLFFIEIGGEGRAGAVHRECYQWKMECLPHDTNSLQSTLQDKRKVVIPYYVYIRLGK